MIEYRDEWPLLIVAPKAVLTQWAEEVRTWTGAATRIQVIKKGKDQLEDVDAVIVTHDILAKSQHLHRRPGDGREWRCVILDESHKCKDPSTKRTKAILPIATRAERCALLTGTPMPQGANDVFTQLTMALPLAARAHLPNRHTWLRRYPRPRRKLLFRPSPPPRNIHDVAAASPRNCLSGRLPRNIHVVAAASPRTASKTLNLAGTANSP